MHSSNSEGDHADPVYKEEFKKQQEEAASWGKRERQKKAEELSRESPQLPPIDMPSDDIAAIDKLTNTRKCASCARSVIALEQVQCLGRFWHRDCFKCSHCGEELEGATLGTPAGSKECKPLCKACYSQQGKPSLVDSYSSLSAIQLYPDTPSKNSFHNLERKVSEVEEQPQSVDREVYEQLPLKL